LLKKMAATAKNRLILSLESAIIFTLVAAGSEEGPRVGAILTLS
jgi:hypothetical protein